MWRPRLVAGRPLYLSIADALARDVAEGRLATGARLPTQRELAETLGVTVGTVTRGYAEAARRGLVSGEVGRGSFVRGPAPEPASLPGALVELGVNHPPAASPPLCAALQAGLAELARSPSAGRLLDYPPEGGADAHRAAGARWVQRFGLPATPDQVLVTSGSQHALTTVFTAFLRPGEVVLTEALTYPGMKALAALLGLRLLPLAMDEHGLRPEALEAACRGGRARALYTVPSLHNPTTVVLPEERRREIAAIARRHGLLIVEDDVHGPLLEPSPRPLSLFAPELSVYLAGMAKILAPGLRIGFLVAPPGRLPRLLASIRATTWMAAPLMAELTARWILDGTAAATLAEQRVEAQARQAQARRILGRFDLQSHPRAHHLWLRLPAPWRSDSFCEEARRCGVAVTPAQAFVVGRAAPPAAVRVCLGAARDRGQLGAGLGILADLLVRGPEAALAIV
jgi:DNA-binding transcriptional MocR family regulator